MAEIDPKKERFCFTVKYIEGCDNFEYYVVLNCTTVSCECEVMNRTMSYEFCLDLLPGLYDIKITDYEAKDEINENPAYFMPGYYIPSTTMMNQSNETCC